MNTLDFEQTAIFQSDNTLPQDAGRTDDPRWVPETMAQCTATPVVPLTPLIAADIVAEPTPVPVTSPELFTAATSGADEVQLAPTRFWVVPSLKLPAAVNCFGVPKATSGLPGETVIDFRLAFVTVTCLVAVTGPSVAVIVDCPAVTPETVPV